MIFGMADFGPPQYVNAAVQVIPVLGLVVLADSFVRRDASHPVHRHYASTAVIVGLLFGIGGEIAGLQALLTGPTRQTVPVVSAGLMALGATALLPRIAELHVPRNPDLARRVTNMFLPRIIGTVGIVTGTSQAPLGARLGIYAFLALGLLLGLAEAVRLAAKDRSAPASSSDAPAGGRSQDQRVPADDSPAMNACQASRDLPQTAPEVVQPSSRRRSAHWLALAAVTGIGVGAVIGHRGRGKQA
jgi:hypothetical protein